MIGEEEAKARVLGSLAVLPSRKVALSQALNAFCARDLFASLPLPIFSNSAMDGYAIASSSCVPGQALRVVGEQPAGRKQKLRVGAGEAVRIFTGAPIPDGADAVVMQEDATERDGFVTFHEEIQCGEFVRERGCDLGEGQKIIAAGERINSQKLALLASQGFAEVEVGGEVRVAIISTGDELIGAGAALEEGQLYESNSVLLSSMARQSGAVVARVEHCTDSPEAIEAAFKNGVEYDALIVSGGVSVGARDFVKESLRSIGAEIGLWRVAVKPGKPFLFGRAGKCSIFGLPGNPVSAFVTFLLFVRPALLKMAGARESELSLPTFAAVLNGELRNDGDRPHYIRGNLRDGEFLPSGRQESHALFGLSQSNALLRMAAGEELAAGAAIRVSTWH